MPASLDYGDVICEAGALVIKGKSKIGSLQHSKCMCIKTEHQVDGISDLSHLTLLGEGLLKLFIFFMIFLRWVLRLLTAECNALHIEQ